MECKDCKAAQIQTAVFLELMMQNRSVHWVDEQKSDKGTKNNMWVCMCVWVNVCSFISGAFY